MKLTSCVHLFRQSAGADDEFENLFSEKEEEVVSTMTADEYIKAMQYRAMASADNKSAAPTTLPSAYPTLCVAFILAVS